jgi:hypothetical protein
MLMLFAANQTIAVPYALPCANFSGMWAGTCVSGKESYEEALEITQQECLSATIAYEGSEPTKMTFNDTDISDSQSDSERQSAVMYTKWSPNRTRAITYSAGLMTLPRLDVIMSMSKREIYLESDQLHVDFEGEMNMVIGGVERKEKLSSSCVYNRQ